MKKIFDYFKNMGVDDALIIFNLFGVALIAFALTGGYLHFFAGWVADWLLFSGLFVMFVTMLIMFGRNGFFVHDITESDKK